MQRSSPRENRTGSVVFNYAKTIFIERREGKIVLFGSLIYLLVWAVHMINPSLLPIPLFYALISPFIPFALALSYFKMGGFKRRGFESGWFNTSLLLVVLLAPLLVNAYAAIRR